MKRSRFTEEHIIGILREQEAGVATAEVCRRHGVSSATFYKWKAKFGGMDVSEARRLKALEDENTKLKRMLADAMLDNVALKDLLGKTAKLEFKLVDVNANPAEVPQGRAPVGRTSTCGGWPARCWSGDRSTGSWRGYRAWRGLRAWGCGWWRRGRHGMALGASPDRTTGSLFRWAAGPAAGALAK